MIDEEEIPDDEDPVENQDEVKEEPIKLPPNLSKFSSQYKSYYNTGKLRIICNYDTFVFFLHRREELVGYSTFWDNRLIINAHTYGSFAR